MNMIERVTWAVCPILRAAEECDMPQIINGPRPECKKCPPTERSGGTAGCRVVAELVARAAIVALREPTWAMSTAAFMTCGDEGSLRFVLEAGWRAMIDEILADKP